MVDITIIMPIHNAEDFLPELLVSLAEQTYQGFRLIIIDDCSTDSSCETARYLTKPFSERVVVLRNEKNMGQSETRNAGLDEAAKNPTKYVTFLDADDWIEPEYLEDLHSAAERFAADLTISGIVRFDDETGCILATEMVSYPNKVCKDSSDCDDLGQINTCPYAKLYRFDKILNLRFRIAKRSEDTCYMFEALPHLKRITFTNNALYHYRVRKGSITSVIGWETVESMHQLFSEAYETFLTDAGAPYRELFESQVYIRSSVGGVNRAAFADMGRAWAFSRKELEWLDSVMPAWRNNKYLSFGRWRSRTLKQFALKTTVCLYKAHVYPLFIYFYYCVSMILKREIRA